MHDANGPVDGASVMKSQSPSTGLLRRLFPLPPVQRDAAENWVSYGSRTPRAARRASSVVLIRDSPHGVETYVGYRPGGSPLGSVAFPGGSLETDDDEDIPWYGPSLSEWSKRLGILDQRLVRAQLVCAIRELFEETGVLLAGTDELSVVENCISEDWMSIREAVAGQDKTFASVLRKRGLGLRTDLLRPLAHWISPNFALRRFDTRYFAAALPVRQEPSLLRGKGVWASWLVAAEALGARNTTELGDAAGAPDTVGLPLSMVSTPAVEVILEKIASTRGTVAYLSVRRELKSYHPELVQIGDEFFLDVSTTTAAEGGGGGRGR